MLLNLKLYIKMIWWKYNMKKYINLIGQNAKKASLEKINTKTKNNVLKKYVLLLVKEKKSILRANIKDVRFAVKKRLKNNLIDRLTINQEKLIDIQNLKKFST